MADVNPFESILDEITDILKEIKEKGVPSSMEGSKDDIDEKLKELELMLQLFTSVTDQAIKTSGVDTQKLEQDMKVPSSDTIPSDMRMLERAKGLKSELEGLENRFAKKVSAVKKIKKKSKKPAKTRKKKFQKLGGDGWMPL